MNEKFCILHDAAGAEYSIQNFEFIVHSASARICKQNTNLAVSNTFNISLVVLASKSRTLSLTKQNKTNAILKIIIPEKSTTNSKNCSEQVEL